MVLPASDVVFVFSNAGSCICSALVEDNYGDTEQVGIA